MTFFLSFGCWIEPYWCMNFIETVHNIQSNSVHYFLSWTNHSLAPLKIRRYHHFSCPTQQLFYKVEIICFSIILMTNKPFFSRIHISIPSSFFNIYILTPVPDQISAISHSYNFEYTPSPIKGTVLRRRLRWAAWRYSTGKEASLALPLLLITQHLYIRGIPAAY